MKNEQIVPPQTVKQFDQELFDQIAQKYARKDIVPSSSRARYYQIEAALGSLLKSRKSLGTLVDVGCGIGQIALQLHGKYQQYIGIDHSEKMISLAKIYNPTENVRFFADDVGSIGFIDNTADIVFARGFLHHVDDLDRIMIGLKRIAKPGAYFIAIEPNNGNILIQFFRKIRQKIDPQYSHLQHYFSRDELLELLDRANMKEVNIIHHGYVTPPFAEIVLNPQSIFLPIVKFLVFLDDIILRWAPPLFRPLSWNLIVFARFPEDKI